MVQRQRRATIDLSGERAEPQRGAGPVYPKAPDFLNRDVDVLTQSGGAGGLRAHRYLCAGLDLFERQRRKAVRRCRGRGRAGRLGGLGGLAVLCLGIVGVKPRLSLAGGGLGGNERAGNLHGASIGKTGLGKC